MALGTWTIEALKEYIEQRFKAVDEKFVSSDKAIIKAERAQEQYNVVHNDLVRKNELMQTRLDAEKDRAAVEAQINSIRINLESQINSLRLNIDEKFKNVTDKIEGLKSGADKGEGKEAAITKFIGWIVAGASILFQIYNASK